MIRVSDPFHYNGEMALITVQPAGWLDDESRYAICVGIFMSLHAEGGFHVGSYANGQEGLTMELVQPTFIAWNTDTYPTFGEAVNAGYVACDHVSLAVGVGVRAGRKEGEEFASLAAANDLAAAKSWADYDDLATLAPDGSTRSYACS